MNSKIVPVYVFAGAIRLLSTSCSLSKTHYEILGINSGATSSEIKKAYFEKTKLYHPDKVKGTQENLEQFRLISEAYEVLGNAVSRREYDENVLGIQHSDASVGLKQDDIIKSYKLSRHEDKLHLWTREHCNSLRRTQFKSQASSLNYQVKKSEMNSNDSYSFGLILVAGLFVFAIIYIYSDDKDDKLKRIREKFS